MSFQPTYEELKLCLVRLWRLVSEMVFSLPTRNWNNCSKKSSAPFSYVFSLPTRNWNHFCVKMVLTKLLSFQPTYEELKHSQMIPRGNFTVMFSAYLRGIETLRRMWSGLGQEGFQPTYEELKPAGYKDIDDMTGGVFSLPTRNWNILSTIKITTNEKFSAYLRGIETPIPFWFFPVSFHVFSLPTRNWNKSFARAKPPMIKFSAYLRGIETTIWLCGIVLMLTFSAYLRGIETGLNKELCLKNQAVFSLPTRIWNPEIERWDWIAWWVFSLPTRNWNSDKPSSFALSTLKFSAYLRGIETAYPKLTKE